MLISVKKKTNAEKWKLQLNMLEANKTSKKFLLQQSARIRIQKQR